MGKKNLRVGAEGAMEFLRAIDICCGGGGWAVAARGLPISIEFVFDKKIDCLLTYKENHPNVECVCCDVIDFDFSKLKGKVDLILGGIPCEDISPARRGTPLPKENEDKLHALIDKCLELHEKIDAQYYCFEDVRDVLRHVPPFTDNFLLNSANYSPQRRIRAYLGNVPIPRKLNDQRSLQNCILPGPYRRSMAIRKRIPKRTHVYNTNCFYPWYPDEKSPTVLGSMSRHDNYMAVWENLIQNWRQLEWREAALLQGFPSDYVFIGSLSRTIKMIAQAVQIDTARAILKSLCRKIKILS